MNVHSVYEIGVTPPADDIDTSEVCGKVGVRSTVSSDCGWIIPPYFSMNACFGYVLFSVELIVLSEHTSII